MHAIRNYLASALFPALIFVTQSTGAAPNSGYERDNRQSSSQQNRPPGPPQEAITACQGKSPGAKVQIRTPYGHLIGATCKLIAVPDHGGRPQGGSQGGTRRYAPAN